MTIFNDEQFKQALESTNILYESLQKLREENKEMTDEMFDLLAEVPMTQIEQLTREINEYLDSEIGGKSDGR